MSELSLLIELQSVHDNLAIIQRDLTAYPPDLAALDAELKGLARKLEDIGKGLATGRTQATTLSGDLDVALRAEEVARTSLRGTTQKIQYTAAIRELDERQRQKAAVARPLKETEDRIQALESQEATLREHQAKVQQQFDELLGIFLAEHENQVAARTVLETRAQELEAALPPALLTKFRRLLQQRHGKAVAEVDGGACGGCRTRLRGPVLARLRDADDIQFCENCQRVIFEPARR
jgi:predicted  nucleic acid-binding Zn-ribbon protein